MQLAQGGQPCLIVQGINSASRESAGSILVTCLIPSGLDRTELGQRHIRLSMHQVSRLYSIQGWSEWTYV